MAQLTGKRKASSIEDTHWDETAILFITTHGCIVEKNKDVDTFKVPEGITIKRFLATSPGMFNISTEKLVDGYNRLITTFKRPLLSKRKSTQDAAIETIRSAVKSIEKHGLPAKRADIKELRKKINTVPDEDDDLEEDPIEFLRANEGYVSQFDNAFKTDTFRSGNDMLNKTYKTDYDEPTKNNWVINVMNIRGHPDLFNYLQRPSVTLKDVVEFLRVRGVKEIILFDFSCSNIVTSHGEDVSPRKTRIHRRSITKDRRGGKRTKKHKNHKRIRTIRKY